MINLNDSLETLIRTSENPEGIDWFGLCQSFILPEDFVREYKDYVNWQAIDKWQWCSFSVDFLREFKDKFPNLLQFKNEKWR